MTEPNRRYIHDKTGSRDRQRVRRCYDDRAILVERGGIVLCPECGRTAGEMAEAER